MTQRVTTRWSSLLVLLMSLALVAAACQPVSTPPTTSPGATQPGASPSAAEDKDANATIKLNLGTEPLNYDPQHGSFVGEIVVNSLVFEPMLALNVDTSAPEPATASALPTVSSDGMTYTVKLKSGLKYSDGAPLTAKNYAFGIKRGCDPRLQSEYAFVLYDIVGCEEVNGLDAKDNAAVDAALANVGVKAVDDTTLEIKLKQAAGYFSAILTMWPTYPVREDMVTKGGGNETWWQDPATFVGNGSMVLKEWQKGSKMVFEANPNWRNKLQFKTLELYFINEAAVAFAAYQDNQLDMKGVASTELRTVEADPALSGQVMDTPGACSFYYGMNVRRPPFNDVNARQAFAKAFDRGDYVKNQLSGLGVSSTSFIMPGVPGHDTSDTFQKFDPAAAKALWDKVSPEAKAAPIKYTYSESAIGTTRAEWAVNQWKTNLGVTVELEPVASTAYTGLFRLGKDSPQLFGLGWCWDFPDPQNQLTAVWAHGNFAAGRTGYAELPESKEFDALVDKADRLSNLEERVTLYKQAGKLLSQHAPAAWTVYNQGKVLVKPWIKGIKWNPKDTSSLVPIQVIEQIYVLKH